MDFSDFKHKKISVVGITEISSFYDKKGRESGVLVHLTVIRIQQMNERKVHSM